MAIVFPNSFIITAADPIDSRLVMTKAQMLAARSARMPDYYFVLCKDDKRIYIYDKSITTPDPVVGNFKPIEEFLEFTSTAAKAKFEAALAGSAKFTALETKVGNAQTAGSLVYNVNQLQEDVQELEVNVTELEAKVEDEDTGLIPKVAKAQVDIANIKTWINNVKLDGGEVKPQGE